MKKGLLMVHTGDGKGKTTAALGLALRAIGHGMKVCVIQFLKGSWKYGELEAAKCFGDALEIHVMGKGFTWESENIEDDKRLAREAWEFAKTVIASGRYALVILDELTYLITYKFLEEREILDVLTHRPADLHVVVTGRGASQGLIEAADLVTEMTMIKHPFNAGLKAQKGIEF